MTNRNDTQPSIFQTCTPPGAFPALYLFLLFQLRALTSLATFLFPVTFRGHFVEVFGARRRDVPASRLRHRI